jgi:hypothetical protein
VDDEKDDNVALHVSRRTKLTQSENFEDENGHFCSLLTVYFGAPSMFITLWFGFDYGTFADSSRMYSAIPPILLLAISIL